MLRVLFLSLFLPLATPAVRDAAEKNEPSFLTPFIETNRIDVALKNSFVEALKGENVVNHAGFLTVNKYYNSSLFMWFFESETLPKEAPVVLYLHESSAFEAIFNENGRYYLKPSKGLGLRKHYWSQSLNMIYMDSQLGTGFSFTSNNEGYAKNENQAAADLYNALVQFFRLFNKYSRNEFYIVGDGYGGKLAVSLADFIDGKNQGDNAKKINLKGLAVGNALIDPVSMVDSYANFFYSVGLINLEWKKQFEVKQSDLKNFLSKKQFSRAVDAYIELIGHKNSMFSNVTGYRTNFNILHETDNRPYGNLERTIKTKPFLRNATHVGQIDFDNGRNLVKESIMRSVKPNLEKLIPKYRILVYSGQLNPAVPYIAVSKFVNNIKWSESFTFKLAPSKVWFVDGKIAGYCKNTKILTLVMIKGAGQLVSFDQPKAAKDMIVKFTTNQFDQCSN